MKNDKKITNAWFEIHRKFMEKLRRAEWEIVIDLSNMQIRILMYVTENKHMWTTDVADYFNIATATASIAIKKLVKKWYMEKHPSKFDKRSIELRISKNWEKEMKKWMERLNSVISDWFNVLDKKEKKEFWTLLDRIYKNL